MALSATIFKAVLNVSDLDRHYYGTHALTVARHPSETDERMMVRILVFALHAHEDLAFTKGLSSDEEPDLWLKDPSGDIRLWIELGQPDEKRIRRACGRARQVLVYAYGERAAPVWWEKTGSGLGRFANLRVVYLPGDSGKRLAALAHRNMDLQCTVQEGQVWLGDDRQVVEVELREWKTGG